MEIENELSLWYFDNSARNNTHRRSHWHFNPFPDGGKEFVKHNHDMFDLIETFQPSLPLNNESSLMAAIFTFAGSLCAAAENPKMFYNQFHRDVIT